jgi:hypothetical protein
MFQSLAEQSFLSGGPDYTGPVENVERDMQACVANSLFLNFTLGIGWLAF